MVRVMVRVRVRARVKVRVRARARVRVRAHLDDVNTRAVTHELYLALDVLGRVGLQGQHLVGVMG